MASSLPCGRRRASSLLSSFVFSLLQLVLQGSECTEVAEGWLFNLLLDVLYSLGSVLVFSLGSLLNGLLLFSDILLPYAAVANHDPLVVPIELDDNNRDGFVNSNGRTVFLAHVAGWHVAVQTVLQLHVS